MATLIIKRQQSSITFLILLAIFIMVAKRALDFSGMPAAKRRRTPTPMLKYRVSKPELKAGDYTIAHTAVIESNLDMTAIAQGTEISQRTGNKLKVLRFEGIVRSSVPVRIQILAPNDVTSAPSNTFERLHDYSKDVLLGEYVFDAQVANSFYYMNHRIPLGKNVQYLSNAAGSCNRGKVIIRLTTATAATVTGEFRTYFVDP